LLIVKTAILITILDNTQFALNNSQASVTTVTQQGPFLVE